MAELIRKALMPDVVFHCFHCHSDFKEALRSCVPEERQERISLDNPVTEWEYHNGEISGNKSIPTLSAVCPVCGYVCTIDRKVYDNQVARAKEEKTEEYRAKCRVEKAREMEREQIRNEHFAEYREYEKRISKLYTIRVMLEKACFRMCYAAYDNESDLVKAIINYEQVEQMYKDVCEMYFRTKAEFAEFKTKYNYLW